MKIAARQVCESILNIPRKIPELSVKAIKEQSEASEEMQLN